MRFIDRQKRDIEDFKKLLPYLNQLIRKVHLTNKAKTYHLNKANYITRVNGEAVHISLAEEASIFPTLAFREVGHVKTDLLYFRIGQNFKAKLLEAI